MVAPGDHAPRRSALIRAPKRADANYRTTSPDVRKYRKGILYGALAVTTLGLSEIVTNPVEGTAGAGKEMQVKVIYDAQNAVHLVEVLKDERWLQVQKIEGASAPNEQAK